MVDRSAMDMWYAGRKAAVKLKGLDIEEEQDEDQNTSDIGEDEEPNWPEPPLPLVMGAQGSDEGISLPWPVPEEPGWQPNRRRVGLIFYDGGSSSGSEDGGDVSSSEEPRGQECLIWQDKSIPSFQSGAVCIEYTPEVNSPSVTIQCQRGPHTEEHLTETA
ncbi:hypothetical protein CAPTEDRAFT_190171 [Capitella teleta]|uniref:Uncharacterized protein n=1 Tax=Capitella teleta TaxID=283909 RepID=R7UTK0_CAPTE|nr:hypothetical protein CAPTEDRAFT_190171 [Capitella teleta]|eukprot:ELU07247.1 hypothetical protein CAPTEDRAFT_190171 [Capitella teleta]